MGKTETIPSRNGQVDDKLMKPFALGWTREVVKRVVTKNPTCDIYYFSPSGKKLRSLREAKEYLTDGLSLDCFSFKREILGVDSKFETVRDATCRKKQCQKSAEGGIDKESESGPSGVQQPKKRKIKIENPDLSLEETNTSKDVENIGGKEVESNAQGGQIAPETSDETPQSKIKRTGLAKASLVQVEKKVFKRVMRRVVRQNQALTRKRLLRKAIAKAIAPKNEVTENTNREKMESKNKGGIVLRSMGKSVASVGTETEGTRDEPDLNRDETPVESTSAQTEHEDTREVEAMEEGKDLKSIVQKNIVKYRKLREKQKLKLIRSQLKKNRGKVVTNSRAESFWKNRSNYLKPLQKGWRRELVYRSNCSKAGLQADVYYIHPSGKKFRSTREIMDNPDLIRGLSVDFFTFRKEAVGCGEPLEVIRSARTSYKN